MNEKANEQIIEIYKTMLSQEISNHTIAVTILLAITIVLLGITWWWNKQGAKKTIEREVKKRFELEKSELIKQMSILIEEKVIEFEHRLCSVEADTARSIGISASQQKLHHYAAGWFSDYLLKSIKAQKDTRIRSAASTIIQELELVKGDYLFNLPRINEAADALPVFLDVEKKKIKSLIKEKKEFDKE